MESGARPSAPDKIHFTSQSHQLYRPSTPPTLPPVLSLSFHFLPFHFHPPARVRDRGSCVPRSSARQVGVGLVEGRRWRSIPLAISSMYSRRRRLHSQSSPQYETTSSNMTLPRIALDVELALQLQGQGVEREMRAP